MEQLAKQSPVTLEEARAQAKWLKSNGVCLDRKKRV
jgi:hypothetical protein